jgi:hypothetical protein
VGNGDAIAHPSRAQALALEDDVEDLAGWQTTQGARPFGKFLQSLLLGARPQRRDDGLRRDQI